jgi:hypothetical protein
MPTTSKQAEAPPSPQSQEFEHPLLTAPRFIKEWPAWAAWSAPQKRPLDLRRALAGASTTDPDTWATFEYALRHLKKIAPPLPYPLPVPVGVGILIAPPLIFVDFDDLLDAQGNAPVWATEFIQQAIKLGAYTERSASGQGAHALLRVPPGFSLRRNRYTREHPSSTPVGIELYAQERFCALTGIPIGPAGDALNDPEHGATLLTAFIAELDAKAAPILTAELPPAPLTVPAPTQPVLDLLPSLLTPNIKLAFDNPSQAYELWQKKRHLKGSDNSMSAWRFSLYYEASRACPVSPAPVYELFNPQAKPVHPGIHQWQEFSGQSKKSHRKYADIQRAHALVVEELKMLAMDLDEAPPLPEDHKPKPDIDENAPPDPTWAQLGLVMRTGANGVVKPLASSVNFIRVLEKHPFFSKHKIERNELDGQTMCDRQPLKDSQITIWQEPLRAVLDMPKDPPPQAVRDAVEVVADRNSYNPLAEYLASLPRYTPPSDYDADASLLSCWLEKIGASQSPDLKKFARRILLGLVARALKAGVKFDYVPVFEGPQGVGKSTLVKLLVGAPYYATLFGGLHSKDALMTLRGKWGVEISELAAFKKTDNETMKSFFSTDTDVFRPPYGRNMISTPRRTVLFGTTNDKQYLTDHTGARRFWPIYFMKSIDLAWFIANRDALFAEALYWFEHGEAYHDTLEELQDTRRQREMTRRMVTPAWQLKLLKHLQNLPVPKLPSDDEPGFSGVLSPDYIASLQQTLELPLSVTHMNMAQLASFLHRAGYNHHVKLSYRPTDGNSQPTKLYRWGHPAIAAMTPDQQRAFLSHFPSLFNGGESPAAWTLLRDEHLEAALDTIRSTPLPEPVDYSGEGE